MTGSGKTATMAFTIEQLQRPTLVIAHNKTLAAQLCNEFREFFPDNAVEYFVSYYDYYQPEAYVPAQDLYIEKDSSINEEIERLRHAATAALFGRRDTIVVASVSCIFGLGSPGEVRPLMLLLKPGEMIDRDATLRKLVDIQYSRNDQALGRGTFRVRGETLEVFPAYAETAVPRGPVRRRGGVAPGVRPAHRRGASRSSSTRPSGPPPTTPPTGRRSSARWARSATSWRCARKELEAEGKPLESHRLRQRTQFDMEMLRELGFCNGIENYSRILDGREPGERPYCLVDFFPDDFVCFIDESHQTVPQIGGMYEGDRSRKQTLVEHGFRLPSALDNRPQTFDEFLQITNQIVFVSATPGDYERTHSDRVVEQIVRPTGIIDPEVDVRETKNQIDDLMNEIRARTEAGERTLVTTLTKKMSEDLTDYLMEYGVRVRYLHSEVDTLERIQIIRELRLGEYDVLVGVNLLREGLDLPEVSLVAILDADKEGFLRGETSLIQTIGRAARNIRGKVIMYADKETAGHAHGASPRPTAAARSRSPTTRSTGSRPRRSRRACPTSATSWRWSRRSRADGAGAARRRRRGCRREEIDPHHGRARGGDAGRGRGPALRVRGQAARRDQGAAARAGRDRGRGVAPSSQAQPVRWVERRRTDWSWSAGRSSAGTSPRRGGATTPRRSTAIWPRSRLRSRSCRRSQDSARQAGTGGRVRGRRRCA